MIMGTEAERTPKNILGKLNLLERQFINIAKAIAGTNIIKIGLVETQRPANNPAKIIPRLDFLSADTDRPRLKRERIRKKRPGTSPSTLLPLPYKGANVTSKATAPKA